MDCLFEDTYFKSRYGFNVKDVEDLDTSRYSIQEWLYLFKKLWETNLIKCKLKSDDNSFTVYSFCSNLSLIIRGDIVRFEIKENDSDIDLMTACKLFVDTCVKTDIDELPLLISKKTPTIIHEVIKWRCEIGK